jgi:hypothetical protein
MENRHNICWINSYLATHCISNLFSDIDATILNYETAFGNIRTALEQKVVISTQLVVCRIHDALKHLGE